MSKIEKFLVALLMVSSLANILMVLMGYQLLREPDSMRFFLALSGVGALVCLIPIFFSNPHLSTLRKVFCSILAFPIFAIILTILNFVLDFSKPEASTLKITHKQMVGLPSSRGNTNRVNYILSTLYGGEAVSISVKKSEFDQVDPEKTDLIIRIHEGALGQQWFKNYNLVNTISN